MLRRLREAGFVLRGQRDQHFLHDPRQLEAIVRDARVEPGDRVFEVGTGPGTLTRYLIPRAAEVVTVEVDLRMAEFAERDLGWPDNVTFLRGDVLEKRRLSPAVAMALERIEPFVWVANLPYSVAATLIVAVLESGLGWTRATLLVQREVAGRLTAGPGDGAYGPLSALVRFWAEARSGRAVAPGAFWPPPKVLSNLVHLEPHPPVGGRDEYPAYAAWVKRLFGGRRKRLRRLLKDALGADRAQDALRQAGLDPQARPASLTPDELLALAREFPLKEI